jgi:hypothetical protein
MKKKQPMYMWQCVVCREVIYSEDNTLLHCGRLVQWLAGIEGKGIDMLLPKVKIKVSGYIEITQESFDVIMGYDDPHTGLVYGIHMGYTDATNLEFEPQ